MRYYIRYNGKNVRRFAHRRNAGEAFREMLFKADKEQAVVEMIDENGNILADNRDEEDTKVSITKQE